VGGEDAQSWRERRRRASAFHAESVNRQRQSESEQARALVERFVEQARARGIRPEPLLARSYSSPARYRTGLSGWYIRKDRSVAIGVDGQYYVLTAPGGVRARLRGVHLTPDPPPLVVGLGARDGESRELADLLKDVLERG
jgi:hypothetical protein